MNVFQHRPAGSRQAAPCQRTGITRDHGSASAVSARGMAHHSVLRMSPWTRYAYDYVTNAGIAMNALHEHPGVAVVKASNCMTALQRGLDSGLVQAAHLPPVVASSHVGQRPSKTPNKQEVDHGTA